MRRFVVVLSTVLLFLTACVRNENAANVTKKSELEIVQEIKAQGEIGQYDLNDGWEKVFYLGIEGELVLLEKGDIVVLADDPDVGNAIYEKGLLGIWMDLQGAGKYIRVKNLFGEESGIGTVKSPEDIRIGIGQNLGDPINKDISEMTEEEREYIPIKRWIWLQP